MRYIVVTIFVCTIGMPAAFATPRIISGAALMRKADSAVEPVKQKRSRYHRRSRSLGGIHPLVGSGDY
jgi:hypothetical protein